MLYRPSPYESMEECNASPLAIRMRRESLNCGTRAMLFSSTVGGGKDAEGKKRLCFGTSHEAVNSSPDFASKTLAT